jgi:hypothetical protein
VSPVGETPCPCTGGIAEDEPDCGLTGDPPNDTVNGGCYSEPEIFSIVTCGTKFCGTAGTEHIGGQNYRDTDWYALVLAGPSRVRVEVLANFASFAGIPHLKGGPPVCGTLLGTDWMEFTDACVQMSDERLLSAGTWFVFVAYQTYTGLACGAPYTLVVTCPIFEHGFESNFPLCSWSDTEPGVICP